MSASKTNSINFDSTALNGLRGIAALHILLYHSLIYSEYSFKIYGEVIFGHFIAQNFNVYNQPPIVYEYFHF